MQSAHVSPPPTLLHPRHFQKDFFCQVLNSFTPNSYPCGMYYYFHLVDEETETQRRKVQTGSHISWRVSIKTQNSLTQKPMAVTMENRMVVPQKTKKGVAIWFSNPTSRHIPRQNYNSKDICTPMFTVALLRTAKTWTQPKCLSTDEEIKKIGHRYTMAYYSATKMNERMLFAATLMNLENIILSKVSQKEKINSIWYHLFVESKIQCKWTYLPNRNRQRYRELTCRCPEIRRSGGGKVEGFGMSRCKLL